MINFNCTFKFQHKLTITSHTKISRFLREIQERDRPKKNTYKLETRGFRKIKTTENNTQLYQVRMLSWQVHGQVTA